MSSLAVRSEVKAWLSANYSSTPWFDMTEHYDIDEVSPDQRSSFLLIQFVPTAENVTAVGPGACWREDGVVFLHYVMPVGGDTQAALVACEALRMALRGKRIGVTVIEAVSPPTDVDGAGIRFEGNWHGFSMRVDYYADHAP